MCLRLGLLKNGRAGRGRSRLPLGITTWILGLKLLSVPHPFLVSIAGSVRSFCRHWILPCLYTPIASWSDVQLEVDFVSPIGESVLEEHAFTLLVGVFGEEVWLFSRDADA
jgi:hypothetical protein